jgi:nitronate monooxygenase
MNMPRWPNRRILDLFGIDLPIIQAPMAGPGTPQLVIAVSEAGGLGSLPCAQLNLDQARAALDIICQSTSRPINLNFFCHPPPQPDPVRALAWRARLAPYYVEHGLDPEASVPASGRMPFDSAYCALVEEYRPKVVSVQSSGAKVVGPRAGDGRQGHRLGHNGCGGPLARSSRLRRDHRDGP